MKNVRAAIVRFKVVATAAAAANVIQYNVILCNIAEAFILICHTALTLAIGQGYASLFKGLHYRNLGMLVLQHY